MKSIQTKFIFLILGCILLSSSVIGGAGILNAKHVVDEDSVKIMNLMCKEKTQEINALLSRIQQSVKTLAVYSIEQLESVERLKTDSEYINAYTQKLEAVAVNAPSNTEGARRSTSASIPNLRRRHRACFEAKRRLTAVSGSTFPPTSPDSARRIPNM